MTTGTRHRANQDRGNRRHPGARAGWERRQFRLRQIATLATVMAFLVMTPTRDLIEPLSRIGPDAASIDVLATSANPGKRRTWRQRDIYLGSGVRAAVADMAVKF